MIGHLKLDIMFYYDLDIEFYQIEHYLKICTNMN